MLIIFVLFGAATFLQAGARTPHPRVSREGLKGMKVDDVPELLKIKRVFPTPHPRISKPVPELPGFPKGISPEERTDYKIFLTKALGHLKCPRPYNLDPDHLHSGTCEDLNAKLDILEKISTEVDVVPELPEIITVEPEIITLKPEIITLKPEIITIKPEYGFGLLPPPCSELVPPPRIFRKMLKDMSKEEKVKEKEDLIKDLTQCNDFRCRRWPDIHNPDNWHDSTLCKDLKTNLDILEEKL